jgi:hypothetical protein
MRRKASQKYRGVYRSIWVSVLTLTSIVLIFSNQVAAQEVAIAKVELLSSGDVVIHYNLSDENTDRRYALYLYTSTDNFIQPLELVEGDVGVNLSVGERKTIIWHAKEELGADFVGGLSLELKGNLYVPFISMDSFEDYKVFKRGKAYDLTWTGGRGDNILNFELYQGNEKVKVFEERPNVGNTTLVIPKDVKPGEYRFKISDSRNRDEVVFTSNFQVKRKVPLAVTIGSGVVVGGAAVALIQLLGTGEEEKIGDPPKPSN